MKRSQPPLGPIRAPDLQDPERIQPPSRIRPFDPLSLRCGCLGRYGLPGGKVRGAPSGREFRELREEMPSRAIPAGEFDIEARTGT